MPQHTPGSPWMMGLLSLFSGGVLYAAYQISGPGIEGISSAGAFPLGLGAIMLVSSITLLFQHSRARLTAPKQHATTSTDEPPQPQSSSLISFIRLYFPLPLLVFIALVLGYVLVLGPLGFVWSTGLFLCVSLIYLRRGYPMSSLLIAVIATGLIYGVFKWIFQVYLP